MTRARESEGSRKPLFGCATLLVLLVVLFVGLSLSTYQWHGAYRRREMTDEVRRRGGRVHLGDVQEADGLISGWLHLLLGDEYFTEIDHVWWRPRSAEELELLRAFPKLQSLELAGPATTDAALEKLGRLKQLAELQVDDAVLSPQSLAALSELSSLRSLSFRSCTVSADFSEQSWQPLSKLHDLDTLVFHDCPQSQVASRRGLQQLAELPHLRSLEFRHCGISDDSLPGLYGAPELVDLFLQEAAVSESGMLAIREAMPDLCVCFGVRPHHSGPTLVCTNYLPSARQLPVVTYLAYRGPRTSDATLAVLKDGRSLSTLEFEQCCISDVGVSHLGELDQLRRLTLVRRVGRIALPREYRWQLSDRSIDGDLQITDCGLEHISHLENLSELVITDYPITDGGLQHLRPLRNLTRLFLRSPGITDQGLVHLHGLSALDELSLQCARIEGDGLKCLPAGISWLALDEAQVSDDALTHLAHLTNLQTLSVCGAQITDAGIKPVAALTSLRSLELVDTAISDDCVAELRRALPDCLIDTGQLPR